MVHMDSAQPQRGPKPHRGEFGICDMMASRMPGFKTGTHGPRILLGTFLILTGKVY